MIRVWTWATGARSALPLVVAVLCLQVAGFLAAIVLEPGPFGETDANIYVAAARSMLDGNGLYDYQSDNGFGFTYPPFAALVLASVTPLPTALAIALLQLLALATGGAATALVLRRTGLPTFQAWAASTAVVLVTYPVVRGIASGQLDLLIVLGITVDVLVLSRTRAAGVLVGVALAVKLTPGIFLLLFLTARRWRAAATAVGAAVACTALAWLVEPEESRLFWTVRLWETSHVGAQTAALNQSVAAVVARFTDPASGQLEGRGVVLWLVLCLALVAWVAVGLRDWAEDDAPAALVCVAVLGLLVSPISWHHHWAWFVVVLPFLGARGVLDRSVVPLALAVSGAVVSLPPWWYLGGFVESRDVWTSWGNVVGSLLVVWGVAVLAYTLSLVGRSSTARSA